MSRVLEKPFCRKKGKASDREFRIISCQGFVCRPLRSGTCALVHILCWCERLNEMYLWHGTNVRSALSIAQNVPWLSCLHSHHRSPCRAKFCRRPKDFRIDLAGSSTGETARERVIYRWWHGLPICMYRLCAYSTANHISPVNEARP